MNFKEAVQSLGTTQEQVTAKLREKGIKGEKRSSCRCPIAQYLNTCGFPDVSVCEYAYSFIEGVESECVPLPVAVWDWIIDFDNGKSPEFSLE